eukprot:TRINITY_DN77_c0_g1_i2.p1 TRINITY_DN77_c0_g1~~TRINITY_DN77_c0_g1_i2.p1  ORF type:complete len:315 (-),score=54.05 TRINITY_DN77_c0_g1_i2:105-1049(-)
MPRIPQVYVPRPKIERVAKRCATLRLKGQLRPLQHYVYEEKTVRTQQPKEKKEKKSLPNLIEVITLALKDINSKTGSSFEAIYNYTTANYKVKPSIRAKLNVAFARALKSGLIETTTPRRYKLTGKEPTPQDLRPRKSSKPRGTARTKKEPEPETSSRPRNKKSLEGTKKSSKTSERTTKSSKSSERTTKSSKSSERTKKLKSSERTKKSPKSSESTELVWVWQYYNKGFYNYDPSASDVVESVYQEYLTSPYTCDVRSVHSGEWQYEVDFKQMTQKNILHEAHTVRPIRRYQIPEKEKSNTRKNYGGKPKEVE